MIGWMVGWLIDWSIDQSIDRSIDWLVDWLIDWLIEQVNLRDRYEWWFRSSWSFRRVRTPAILLLRCSPDQRPPSDLSSSSWRPRVRRSRSTESPESEPFRRSPLSGSSASRTQRCPDLYNRKPKKIQHARYIVKLCIQAEVGKG